MKIATWNVNSLKIRLPHVLDWLKQSDTDVVCLQELKLADEKFPQSAFEDAGYHAAGHGQKTYNGVGIISKYPLENVTPRLPGDDSDEQSRYLEAVVSHEGGATRIASLYLPNGNPAPGPKYDYKLAWMDRLIAHAKERLLLEEPFVLAGDYNIIPTADDVHDAKAWEDDALYRLTSREKFRTLANLGFTDAYRACSAEPHTYSFWDYQAGAWRKDNGIRIDHLMLSPQAADRLQSAGIDKDVRGWDQPSDHVPVWCVLE
jgi:exodeoxyribonuclease-3